MVKNNLIMERQQTWQLTVHAVAYVLESTTNTGRNDTIYSNCVFISRCRQQEKWDDNLDSWYRPPDLVALPVHIAGKMFREKLLSKQLIWILNTQSDDFLLWWCDSRRRTFNSSLDNVYHHGRRRAPLHHHKCVRSINQNDKSKAVARDWCGKWN